MDWVKETSKRSLSDPSLLWSLLCVWQKTVDKKVSYVSLLSACHVSLKHGDSGGVSVCQTDTLDLVDVDYARPWFDLTPQCHSPRQNLPNLPNSLEWVSILSSFNIFQKVKNGVSMSPFFGDIMHKVIFRNKRNTKSERVSKYYCRTGKVDSIFVSFLGMITSFV